MEINMHINQHNWLNKKTNEGNKKYLWKINKIDKPLLRLNKKIRKTIDLIDINKNNKRILWTTKRP